jgi:PadR family transcriptional regulator, regulatory protein PadR
MLAMASKPKLSHTAAMILHAIGAGYGYGLSVMEVTGLASGTVYPAVRRLEEARLIRSQWEKQAIANAEQRPVRKYHTLTREGKTVLQALQDRYPFLTKSIPVAQEEHA